MEAKARGEDPAPPPPLHQHQAQDLGRMEMPQKRANRNDKHNGSRPPARTKKGNKKQEPEGPEQNVDPDLNDLVTDIAKDEGRPQQNRLMNVDEALRGRLQEAEKAAKKSADDKYRALADIESELGRERKARILKEAEKEKALDETEREKSADKSVAGRKKMPLDDKGKDTKAGDTDGPEDSRARTAFAEIMARNPVTIFSKSYCPFSAKAKHIFLQAYSIVPPPQVVELDQHEDGPALQALLLRNTGRRTVPNVLISGKSIGGGDETEMLWKSGELPARIKQLGGKKIESVRMNFAFGSR